MGSCSAQSLPNCQSFLRSGLHSTAQFQTKFASAQVNINIFILTQLSFREYILSTLPEAANVPTCIQEVFVSNLERDRDFPQGFLSFPPSLQEKADAVH